MWTATSHEAYSSGLEFMNKHDYEKAAGAFNEAAIAGHAAAQFSLGELCEEGRGVRLSDTDAVGWYRAAADQGHAPSQCNLAIMYEQGRGDLVASDLMAAQLFTIAAESGNEDAQFNLGIYYERGKGGLAKSASDAERCFRDSAKQGNADAAYSLANILLSRGGSEKLEATRLLKMAARKGHALSSRKLAAMTGDSVMAMAATEDHTLQLLQGPNWFSELHHGDVVCVQFSVDLLQSSFMHWALYDMENNQFLEFCGRRVASNAETDQTSNTPASSRHSRRPPPRTRSLNNAASLNSDSSSTSRVNSKRSEGALHQLDGTMSEDSSWDAWNAFGEQVLNLPGIRGSGARFIWGSGTVTMSNATVQSTSPDDFARAWEGHDFFRVLWRDGSVLSRGASAVLEARARLGEVAPYNPLPRYGRDDTGLNCESFIRQCLNGHARSAQAESLSGPDGGLCPVM